MVFFCIWFILVILVMHVSFQCHLLFFSSQKKIHSSNNSCIILNYQNLQRIPSSSNIEIRFRLFEQLSLWWFIARISFYANFIDFQWICTAIFGKCESMAMTFIVFHSAYKYLDEKTVLYNCGCCNWKF